MLRFNNLTSEEIREICQRVSEIMSRRPLQRPRYYFSDWPCIQFSREEISAALEVAWKKAWKR